MFSILTTNYEALLSGFLYTLLSSVIALVCSLIIGVVMAILQISQSKLARSLASIYVEFFRNIPLLIIVMFFYVVIPMYFFNINGFTAGTIGLTLYTSAFIAETVRAGILGVPKGQMEAGRSTGLNYSETMINIILPQAIKIVVPPLGNQFINLVKNSSILAMVAGLDLMYQGDLISAVNFNVFETYIVVACFYLILTLPLSYLMNNLEKRWSISD